MENVYAPETFSATEPKNMLEYFQEYQSICGLRNPTSDDVFQQRLELLKAEFNIPLEFADVKALEELCTTEKLKLKSERSDLPMKSIPEDHHITIFHPITKEARLLETIKCKEVFNVMRNDFAFDIKIKSVSVRDDMMENSIAQDVEPGSTFIYRIIVHLPFSTLTTNRLTLDSLRSQYELLILGSNTLLELADAIKCISDVIIFKEVQDTQVDLSCLLNAKETYPSRCFFIENIFYNDMRHPNSIDYSTIVTKWANENNIGEFKTDSMINKRIDSLKPRLGFGYVYIHQGNCEHIVTFSDARLIQDNDCLSSGKYPKIITKKREVNYLCFICGTHHSSWMVMNSDRLPVKKVFLCTQCCESYMFLNGSKIGDFQLYPYCNNMAFRRVLEDSNWEVEEDED